MGAGTADTGHCWCAWTRGHCSLQLQFEEFKKIMLIVECWLLTPALTRAGRGSDGFPEQVVSRDWSQDCVTLSLSRNIGAIIWSCSCHDIDCIYFNKSAIMMTRYNKFALL